MAHIFKRPTAKSKGVVVFTHKEADYLLRDSSLGVARQSSRVLKRLRRFVFKGSGTAKRRQKYFHERIDELKGKYFLGVHCGSYREGVEPPSVVDFYMTGESTTQFSDEPPFIIPLQSRNFLPPFFRPDKRAHKDWDIISVSHTGRSKNLDLLLEQIRQLYDQGYRYNILLLVPTRRNPNPRKHFLELADRYYAMFNKEERQSFTLLKLSSDLSFPGIERSQVAHFYNCSKVFTLFTAKEGESRVIHEALLSGLPIVCKDDLVGGGRDHLDESNSVMFSDYADAHKALVHAVENYEEFTLDMPTLENELRAAKSLEVLKMYVRKLYEKHGQEFDGTLLNTDHLDMSLPGHLLEGVPWNTDRWTTADVLSPEQFETFLRHV